MFSENRFIRQEPIHKENLNNLLLMCIENKKPSELKVKNWIRQLTLTEVWSLLFSFSSLLIKKGWKLLNI